MTPARKMAREFLRMRRENGTATSLRFVRGWRAGRAEEMRMRVHGHDLHMRTAYADWMAAYHTLGTELDIVLANFEPPEGALVVDAGGFIGTAALRISEAWPQVRVVTLEPSARNFVLLQRNLEGRANVTALNAALAPSTGVATLKDRDTGDWGLTIVEGAEGTSSGETVETVTLEDILSRMGAERAFFVKMDIEGGEAALLDAPGWLSGTALLLIELHERIVPGVTARFAHAARGRTNLKTDGEKILSIAPGAATRDPVPLAAHEGLVNG